MSLLTNLAALWSFNDGTGTNATDSSGNSHTLVLSGSPSWTSSRFGNALTFDGVDDRGSVALPFSTSSTVAAWIKIASLPVASTRATTIASYSAAVEPSFEYSTTLAIQNNSGVGNVVGYCYDGATHYATSTGGVTVGGWTHVAATFTNSGSILCYLNGVQDGSVAIGTQYNSWSSGPVIKIGGTTSGFDNYYNGQMDELGVWSRALSGTEITALYRAGPYPFVAPILSAEIYYRRILSGL